MVLDPQYKAFTLAHVTVMLEDAVERKVPTEQVYLCLMLMAGIVLSQMRTKKASAIGHGLDVLDHGYDVARGR